MISGEQVNFTYDGKQTEESDSVGRIFRLVPFGETLVGQLSLDGYTTPVTAFECKPGQASRREITVELQKK
jgi:hypothetical protein